MIPNVANNSPLPNGAEVEINDKRDANHERYGHVRVPSGHGYSVSFEPGERDEWYEREQLKPTGRSINPQDMPPGIPALPTRPPKSNP